MTRGAGPLPEPAAALPDGLVAYKRTPDFTQDSVPAALLKAHATKEGVWGRIRVTHGELLYRVLDPRREPREALLTPDRPGLIEPTILHEVQLRATTRFFVEFFREPGAA